MKSFILGIGRFLIDIQCAICLIATLVGGIYMITLGDSLFYGLGILIGGIILTTCIFYFVYIVVDIRDSLQELNKRP